MSSRLRTTLRAVASLGVGNVARVAVYRLLLRAGIHPVQRLSESPPLCGPFFAASQTQSTLPRPRAWDQSPSYFGWHQRSEQSVPDWHRNALTGDQAANTTAPWWSIADFAPDLGDIKTVWEASRFDWVVNFAQRARTGDHASLERLNVWLADWCANNPPYRGHNWKCGQEASIRVIHLALGALVLDQDSAALAPLLDLVELHLRRIAPTTAYAIGQSNNHGTSEAAALFIGGSLLAGHGRLEGQDWSRRGRHLLANRAEKLIQPDGSFSQYSLNYHRLMLDTYSVCEIWRLRLGVESFASVLYDRLAAASEWLRSIVDPTTGDAPTIGANDGAQLLVLTDADYRDYRPAVQLAAAMFLRRSAYPPVGVWETHLRWLGIETPPESLPARRSTLFDDGGYAVMQCADAFALLRYPRFRYRPSHADALHVDLWVGGRNLLRDGGSFSYADAKWNSYFSGTGAHNTVQFDDREQMPRLSRFLWGGWLTTSELEPLREVAGKTTIAAAYVDAYGARHARRVELCGASILVTDTVSGFERSAVLRWRLHPTEWTRDGNTFSDGEHTLVIGAGRASISCELASGWESRYYGRKTVIPVAEVRIEAPGEIVSEYRWQR